MGYISKDTLTLDAVLTETGRDYLKLAMFGEDLSGKNVIVKFALSDDDIDYGLWDETPSGSNYVKPYGKVIDNMPVLEPSILAGQNMNHLVAKHGVKNRYSKIEIPNPFTSIYKTQEIPYVDEHHRPAPHPSGLVYLEDYDRNGDGVLTILDIQQWANDGRADVVYEIQEFIAGNIPMPPSVNELPPSGFTYFEDYDRQGDGSLNVLDITGWVSEGRQDVAQELAKILSGEAPVPPRKADEERGESGGGGFNPALDQPVYFEDYDLNGDGVIDVADGVLWVDMNRPNISQQVVEITLGNRSMPQHRPEVIITTDPSPMYFEDFDLNGDGTLNVLDIVGWANSGNSAIAQQVADIVIGNSPQPPHRPTTGGSSGSGKGGSRKGGSGKGGSRKGKA